jgi:hypothetical protein
VSLGFLGYFQACWVDKGLARLVGLTTVTLAQPKKEVGVGLAKAHLLATNYGHETLLPRDDLPPQTLKNWYNNQWQVTLSCMRKKFPKT